MNMVGSGIVKIVAENMKSRLVTKCGKCITKKVGSQLSPKIGGWDHYPALQW